MAFISFWLYEKQPIPQNYCMTEVFTKVTHTKGILFDLFW